MEAVHYQQRTTLHADIPNQKALHEALSAALRSFDAQVHVHNTHVHIFAHLSPATRPIFHACIQQVLRSSDVEWDQKSYITSLDDISPQAVRTLLRDLHRPTTI